MKKVLILFGKSDWEKAKPFSNKDSLSILVNMVKEQSFLVLGSFFQMKGIWWGSNVHLFLILNQEK
jgi:hypothetical protein